MARGSAAGIGLSCVGYYFAYRGIYEIDDGPRLGKRQMRAVVSGRFGGFLAHGGSALDDYALRAAGAEERDAKVLVTALAGIEHGVLATLDPGALAVEAACLAILIASTAQLVRSGALGFHPRRHVRRRSRSPVGQA